MRLIDAPVGLFKYENCIALKTEYMVNGAVEAYIVESGERFWGGVNTPDELNNLEVTPISPKDLVPQGEWIYHECVSSYDGTISGYSCSNCSAFVDEDIFDTNEFHKTFCGNCGARMKEAESKTKQDP